MQFTAAAPELRPLFADLRPTAERYSPPAFYFNFPHNTVVAATTVALLEQTPAPVPFDDLMVARPEPVPDGTAPSLSDARWRMARGLMDYAGARPERLEAGGARLILYDAQLARTFHDAAMEQLFSD
jgi:hypothetical protein